MMDESVRLMTLQQQLEKETDGRVTFFGLNVNDTIRACLTNGLSKRADKIKSDFKVPDKRSASHLNFFASALLPFCRLLTPISQILVHQTLRPHLRSGLGSPRHFRQIEA